MSLKELLRHDARIKMWVSIVISIVALVASLVATGISVSNKPQEEMVATAESATGPWPYYSDRLCSFDGLTCPAWSSLAAGGSLQAADDNMWVGRSAANNIEFDLAGGLIDLDAGTGVELDTPYAQFQADGGWIGTGTDAAWAFSSASDVMSTTAQSVRIQSATTDTTATSALDIDKSYNIGSGTAAGVEVDVAFDTTGTRSGYALDFGISTVSGSTHEPTMIVGAFGNATVADNSEAGYAYGVYGGVMSYGEDNGGLGNVLEGVVGSATALDVINGHMYGMGATATCYGDGYGYACDANTVRGIKGVVDNVGNGQITDADGGFFKVQNRDVSDVTSATGVNVDLLNEGVLGSFRGVNIQTPANSGTLTNNYGLYIHDQWVGTNKYSIYVDGSAPISMLSGQASTGQYGTAIGRRARVNHTGSLVLADSTNADFISATTDRFHAQFVNGYYLYTNAASTTGMFMAAGGSAWNAVSDRGAKEDFATVDGNELLDRIAAMPTIESWQYKGQEGNILHVGAMADDFNSLVDGLGGEGQDRINQGDAIGINLAAIQALARKVDALERGGAVTQSQAYQILLTQPHVAISISILACGFMVSLSIVVAIVTRRRVV